MYKIHIVLIRITLNKLKPQIVGRKQFLFLPRTIYCFIVYNV